MGFQIEHDKWTSDHLRRRSGERLDALKRGHGYGNQLFVEQIWWPLVGHFHGLHPEYEVKDWRGRSYFVDFVWVVGAIRIIFEIMDFGSHGTDRTKYRRDLNRGLFLQAQGCSVYYISLDELKENPRSFSPHCGIAYLLICRLSLEPKEKLTGLIQKSNET
jgi:hypothetical protein